MINYSVESISGAFRILDTWCVYEKPTGQVVARFAPVQGDYIVNQKKNAEKLAAHLNTGGGFDGHTPAFFLTPVTFPPQEEDED